MQATEEVKVTMSEIVARNMTKHAAAGDIEICNWTKRYVFKQGTQFVADGNTVRPVRKAGKLGAAFILGSFKVYSA